MYINIRSLQTQYLSSCVHFVFAYLACRVLASILHLLYTMSELLLMCGCWCVHYCRHVSCVLWEEASISKPLMDSESPFLFPCILIPMSVFHTVLQLGAHGVQSVHSWHRVRGTSSPEWSHLGLFICLQVGCKGEWTHSLQWLIPHENMGPKSFLIGVFRLLSAWQKQKPFFAIWYIWKAVASWMLQELQSETDSQHLPN